MGNGTEDSIEYVDSHTEGEPTRLIIAGGPSLGNGSLMERRQRFATEADDFRQAVLLEPRGFEAMVGALLCEPADPTCAAGVIFFNNSGYLNMCGHGAIGVAVSLFHLGRIGKGKHRLETAVGVVEVDLQTPNQVSIENVPSYRYRNDVELQVSGLGPVVGDIAWGGNWFFLAKSIHEPLTLENLDRLMDVATAIRQEIDRQGITGADDAEIDHIELVGEPHDSDAGARNFVLCPGGEYDRSPCGTGTSAKVACLAAEDVLAEGETWIQESVIGSRFEASYRTTHSEDTSTFERCVVPTITGHAYVCGEGRILRHPEDPFRNGIVGAKTL
ncbi:MAG: proline racemase family protein [Planctomycetota bacterium]